MTTLTATQNLALAEGVYQNVISVAAATERFDVRTIEVVAPTTAVRKLLLKITVGGNVLLTDVSVKRMSESGVGAGDCIITLNDPIPILVGQAVAIALTSSSGSIDAGDYTITLTGPAATGTSKMSGDGPRRGSAHGVRQYPTPPSTATVDRLYVYHFEDGFDTSDLGAGPFPFGAGSDPLILNDLRHGYYIRLSETPIEGGGGFGLLALAAALSDYAVQIDDGAALPHTTYAAAGGVGSVLTDWYQAWVNGATAGYLWIWLPNTVDFSKITVTIASQETTFTARPPIATRMQITGRTPGAIQVDGKNFRDVNPNSLVDCDNNTATPWNCQPNNLVKTGTTRITFNTQAPLLNLVAGRRYQVELDSGAAQGVVRATDGFAIGAIYNYGAAPA